MQVINSNQWLSGGVGNVNSFTVDKSKTEYHIQYFKTKRYVSQLNTDWIEIKRLLSRLKVEIKVINSAIDSEDYKAQTKEIISAIETSTTALNENFQKLFSSVVKRMEAASESDEWFSSVAKIYSDYILNAILGGKLSNVAPSAAGAALTATALTASDTTPDTPIAEALADQADNALSAQSVHYGPNLNGGTGAAGGSTDNGASATPTQAVVGEGRTIEIPASVDQSGICANHTQYDRSWASGTTQRELYEQWKNNGKSSSNGIATLDNRYLVAVSSKFGKVGDNIDVVLNDGQVIHAKIGDMKGSDAQSEWGHQMDGYGYDIIEWEATVPQSQIDLGSWRNKGVSKIVNLS